MKHNGWILTAALFLACGDDETAPPDPVPNPGCETVLEAGDHDFAIQHDGLERTYRLHLPPGYDGATPMPLVLNFHGYTSNGEQQQAFSDLNTTADAEGFAVAYPEGIESSFNGGSLCCGTASADDIDDVGFTRKLVEDATSKACLDSKRVYSTGMSNGGFMSHRLGCEAADIIVAVAPVAGLLGVECTPSRPVPIIHFYGTADQLVPYGASALSNATWLEANGCSSASEVTFKEGTVTCETYSECEGDVTVTRCSAEGMGHCWPGQAFCPFGNSTTDISANTEMWKLFREHSLP